MERLRLIVRLIKRIKTRAVREHIKRKPRKIAGFGRKRSFREIQDYGSGEPFLLL